VFVAAGGNLLAGADPFEEYEPPFDLEADMLFVAASASTALLRARFEDVRFLQIGGSTPMILWFSRVRSLCFGPPGQRRCLDESTGFGYNELNFVALLRGRKLFVPVIFASGELTQLLGHRYGMPKRPVTMTFTAGERMVESAATTHGVRGEVRARLLASGRILARPLDWPAPWWTWPVHFPGGSYIRALIQRVPRAQTARVSGTLELAVPGLPPVMTPWQLGVFVPDLRMQLPAPSKVRPAEDASGR
jgi:hypothetical protein